MSETVTATETRVQKREVRAPRRRRPRRRAVEAELPKKLKDKAYEKELLRLQAELCHLQEWVKAEGRRIIIVLEGRDAAGKGGTIKALTERVSPRVFRVV